MTQKMLSTCFESKNQQSTNIFGAVFGAVSLKNNRCTSTQKVKHHKSSLMSGYVVADSEALVMQKVGTNELQPS